MASAPIALTDWHYIVKRMEDWPWDEYQECYLEHSTKCWCKVGTPLGCLETNTWYTKNPCVACKHGMTTFCANQSELRCAFETWWDNWGNEEEINLLPLGRFKVKLWKTFDYFDEPDFELDFDGENPYDDI